MTQTALQSNIIDLNSVAKSLAKNKLLYTKNDLAKLLRKKIDVVIEDYFIDLEKENYRVRHRSTIYNPVIGRFLSEDPHPGDTVNPMTIFNKYSYSGNNPIMNVDPDGREFFTIGLIISAIIGGITASSNGGNFFEGALIGAAAFTAAFFAGPAMATYLGLKGTAALAVSAFTGGITGGAVGGLGHNMLGLETFGDGFAVGFGLGVSGGSAGYYDNINSFKVVSASKVALHPLVKIACAGLLAYIVYQGGLLIKNGALEKIINDPKLNYTPEAPVQKSETELILEGTKSGNEGGQCYA